ncbi:hypothetical protein, partial [Salmonella sp. s54412]|uniref:hypothetical protein n=1 Tax=Salmonella sp. s54412 TaxID=3160128 RepID=UPI0037547C4A
SFSLNHENMDEFNKNTLTDDAPVNERSPNWHLYRISTSQMNHMKSQSSHWRVTCSFPTHGVDYTDYVRAEFEHFDVMTFTGHGVCKKVEYVNIRGHHCVQCTTKWWQIAQKSFYMRASPPHMDTSKGGCQFKPSKGAVSDEGNFGYYNKINKKFRCTAGPNSTTNWWFGGYM